MLTKNIKFKNFLINTNNFKIKKDLNLLLNEKSQLLDSLKNIHKHNYSKKIILKLKNFINIRIIGMGGSVLGAKAIHSFLENKIKKKFTFIDNLNVNKNYFKDKKNSLNLIISKSGNTLETISNANVLIKKKRQKYIYN